VFDLPLKHLTQFRGSRSALIYRLSNERCLYSHLPVPRMSKFAVTSNSRYNLFTLGRRKGKKGSELEVALNLLKENYEGFLHCVESESH
jgi:hypothetical protein